MDTFISISHEQFINEPTNQQYLQRYFTDEDLQLLLTAINSYFENPNESEDFDKSKTTDFSVRLDATKVDFAKVLSNQYVSDYWLSDFQKLILPETNKVYFMNPTAYTGITLHGERSRSYPKMLDLDEYDFIFWPVNIHNYHWTAAYHAVNDGSQIYYADSLGSINSRVERMPKNLVSVINVFGGHYGRTYSTEVEVLDVQEQQECECGMAVNLFAETLSKGQSIVDCVIDGPLLRVQQAAKVWGYLKNQIV